MALPRTEMATTVELGEAGDIHPRNKQDVGKRLALIALAKEYGEKIEYSGPRFERVELSRKNQGHNTNFSEKHGETGGTTLSKGD